MYDIGARRCGKSFCFYKSATVCRGQERRGGGETSCIIIMYAAVSRVRRGGAVRISTPKYNNRIMTI